MMEREFVTRTASIVALVASALLVGDLFLGWQRASVEVAGVVDVESTSMGWSGWGFSVGLLALLIMVVALAQLRGTRTVERHALTAGVLALGLLAATLLAVFSGDATVDVAGVAAVEVDSTQWPAWAGLVLGVIASVAALVPVVAELGRPAPHGLPGPA
jgi:hypothetical protein